MSTPTTAEDPTHNICLAFEATKDDLRQALQGVKDRGGKKLEVFWAILGRQWNFSRSFESTGEVDVEESVEIMWAAKTRTTQEVALSALGLLPPSGIPTPGERFLSTQERREKIEYLFKFCEVRDHA